MNLSPWRNLIFGCANPNSVDPERIKMILNMLSPGEESGFFGVSSWVFFWVSTPFGLITPWAEISDRTRWRNGSQKQRFFAIVNVFQQHVPSFFSHPKVLQCPREMKTTLDLIQKDLEKQAELRAGHKPADDSEAEDDMSSLGTNSGRGFDPKIPHTLW